jgi:hypothetical protein
MKAMSALHTVVKLEIVIVLLTMEAASIAN